MGTDLEIFQTSTTYQDNRILQKPTKLLSKMRLNVVASTSVALFLAITLLDGTQSRKITGDDIETLDNKDGPKCTFRHSSLECGPTAFCWRGVCRDTIFER